jgi:hypothetical protein
MLWQRLPPFQPRLQDTKIPSSWRHPNVPSSSEFDGLFQIISQAKQDILDYDQDLQCLEAIMLDLRRKRDDAKKYVHKCKTYLSESPIRKLPTEMIREIFVHYQDAHGSQKNGRFREPLSDSQRPLTALTLSSVCRFWRDVSLSTSRLWSRFSLRVENHYDRRCPVGDPLLHLLEIYLSRSRPTPLSFDLTVDRYYTTGFPREILRLLLAESTRWGSASWHNSLGTNLQKELHVLQDIPLLQALELVGPLHEELRILSGACNLRSLSLALDTLTLLPTLRMTQVQFLHVALPDRLIRLAYIANLMACFPALRSLELSFGAYDRFWFPDVIRPEIHFNLLESLSVRNLPWDKIFKILFCVHRSSTAPIVSRTLTLSGYHPSHTV